MPCISVIVPVYNVEAYLDDCVRSILGQTFEDLECILVDDGSHDASPAMCARYARQDQRVRVIHQKNGGLSAARNTGIAAAGGAYISFVDADDVLHPRFLETLYRAVREENALIALCDYQYFRDGDDLPSGVVTDARDRLSRKEAILTLTYFGHDDGGEPMVIATNKLYARRLFDTVRYPVGKWHEDEFAILPLLMQVDKVVRCQAVLYFYRQRRDSITGDKHQADIRHLNKLEALRARCETLKTPEYRDIYSAVVNEYFEMMLTYAYTVARPGGFFPEYRRHFQREFRHYLRWVRGKRFYVFAVCPWLYEKKHGL